MLIVLCALGACAIGTLYFLGTVETFKGWTNMVEPEDDCALQAGYITEDSEVSDE